VGGLWCCTIGELEGGEIGDRDFEVKWGCPCEKFCSGGGGCVLEVEVMSAEELLERYAAGERDFGGIDLKEADLTGTDLSDINLSNANLIDVDLSEANLTSADLSGVRFTNVNLYGTDLAGINLTNVDLRSTVNFDVSSLMGNAVLCQTILPDGTTIIEEIVTEE
jgi:uncharacterized protein YjbI with pentapeptide repeats